MQFKQIAKCEWFHSDDIWNNVQVRRYTIYKFFRRRTFNGIRYYLIPPEKLVNSLDPKAKKKKKK